MYAIYNIFYNSNDYQLLAGLGLIIIIILLIFIPFCVLYIIGRWRLYKKAGKNGWEAIIPFYNDWVYVEIAGLNWWWFLLVMANSSVNFSSGFFDGDSVVISIAPFVSLFALYVCNYNISKRLNKDVGFAVLMTIFPFIMIPLIGLSNSYKFDKDIVVSNNGPFNNSIANDTDSSNNRNNTGNNYKLRYCSHCGHQVNADDKYCNKCGKAIM